MTAALAALCYALAAIWLGVVARDLGRRFIAYRDRTVTEAAELAALRRAIETHDKAIANLAKTFAAELAIERDKIAKLEAQRAATILGSKSAQNTTSWRQGQ